MKRLIAYWILGLKGFYKVIFLLHQSQICSMFLYVNIQLNKKKLLKKILDPLMLMYVLETFNHVRLCLCICICAWMSRVHKGIVEQERDLAGRGGNLSVRCTALLFSSVFTQLWGSCLAHWPGHWAIQDQLRGEKYWPILTWGQVEQSSSKEPEVCSQHGYMHSWVELWLQFD